MHKPGLGVTKVGLRLPGVILQNAPANKFVPQPWYNIVEWVDGNRSEEPHEALRLIQAPPENVVLLLN